MRIWNVPRALRAIWTHPLTRDRKSSATLRYVRWQIGSRLVPGAVVVDWVNSSKLVAGAGFWGATMNVYCGLSDFAEMGFLLHLLRPADLFVDVGANVGTYSVLSGVAIGAQSVAIEPSPVAFARLQANIAVNGAQARIRALNAGASHRESTMLFGGGDDTLNRVLLPGEQDGRPALAVPVITLDQLLEEQTPVLLKIDVEGYETPVVDGGRRLLERDDLLALIIEMDGHGAVYGFDEEALGRKLVGIGFVSCAYSPFTRELAESVDTPVANRLYVRGSRLEEVRRRLRSAPAFVVWGRVI